jgi:ATP-dependent protease Clp ATPase subunit
LTVLTQQHHQPRADMAETRLTSLSVTGFRNYASCQLDIAASNVLLLGPNGAG